MDSNTAGRKYTEPRPDHHGVKEFEFFINCSAPSLRPMYTAPTTREIMVETPDGVERLHWDEVSQSWMDNIGVSYEVTALGGWYEL